MHTVEDTFVDPSKEPRMTSTTLFHLWLEDCALLLWIQRDSPPHGLPPNSSGKKTGVGPIRIFEVPLCTIAKAVLSVIRPDVLDAMGSLQLCAGQISGVEAETNAV